MSKKRRPAQACTMKCVRDGDMIRRVRNEEALDLFLRQGWVYCSKTEWKKQNKNV